MSQDLSIKIVLSAVDQATTPIEALGRTVQSFAKGMAAAFGAISVGSLFGSILAESAEAERQFARTEQLVRATGEAAGFTAEQLREQARALALATLQSTQGVQEAQQVMLTFRSVTGDTFTRAIELATDMSSVFGQSLTGSVTQLGKALEDPVAGLTALRRVGVSFTEAQREQIEAMVAAGDAAKAQSLILDVLAAQMGGVARAEALGYAGAVDTLNQRWQEFKLAIGEALDVLGRSAGVIGAIAAGVAAFTATLESGRLDAIVELINLAMDGLAATVSLVVNALGLAAGVLVTFISLASNVPSPILATVAVVALLSSSLGVLTSAAITAAGALTTLVIGTVSRSIALWGTLTAAVGATTAALRALAVAAAANPLGAILLGVGAAVTAFQIYRNTTAETTESIARFRRSTDEQIKEVENLRAAMARAEPGSEAYSNAARRLAEIVPGLTLSLDAQGGMIARVGAGYEDNTRKLDAYINSLREADQAALLRQITLQYDAWRQTSAAVEDSTEKLKRLYGETETTRTGWQSLELALGRALGFFDRNNREAVELNETLREQDQALRTLALQLLASGQSFDEIAQAMRDLGASGETVEGLIGYLETMTDAADGAAEGLTRAQAAIGQAGVAAATALGETIGSVSTAIAGLDTQLAEHQRNLATAQQAEAAGWKALGEAARGTYDVALAEVERYVQARREALLEDGAGASETAARMVEIEREAATARLTALRAYQAEALRLVEDEGRRRLATARATGQNVRQVELEILTAKRETLRTIEAEYRRHVDSLNSEARRHLDEVRRIEQEIQNLRMSTEDRIRELRRSGMTDVEQYNDLVLQAEEKAAAARAALAEGNVEQSRTLAAQAADIWERSARAQVESAQKAADGFVDAGNTGAKVWEATAAAAAKAAQATADGFVNAGNTGAKVWEASAAAAAKTTTVVGDEAQRQERAIAGINEMLDLQVSGYERAAEAAQGQADEAQTAAQAMESALEQVRGTLETLTETLSREINLKLEVDQSAVDGLVNTIEPLLADRTYYLQVQANLESVQASLEEAGALARDNPIELRVIVGQAEGTLAALQGMIEQLGDAAPVDLKMNTGKAVAAINDLEARLDGIADTESEHVVQTNADQARREIDALNNRNTSSTHTIYVRKVETNATGGLVGTLARFARGGLAGGPGWDVVPGAGNTDSVRADLPAGAFVLRKSATRYYGDLLRRLAATRFAVGGMVPSLLMPGERWFRPETVGRLGVGLFEALNRMAIPREHLAAAMAHASAPVARFADGGLVSRAAVPMGSTAGSGTRDTVDINLRLGTREVRLSGAREQAASLASALRELARGG